MVTKSPYHDDVRDEEMIAIAEAVEAIEEEESKAPSFELQFTPQGSQRTWKNILQNKRYSAALRQLCTPRGKVRQESLNHATLCDIEYL